MARYNHFSEPPYRSIMFSDLKIGDKFRLGMFQGKRSIYKKCIKTSRYKYDKDGNECFVYHDNINVYEYKKKPNEA